MQNDQLHHTSNDELPVMNRPNQYRPDAKAGWSTGLLYAVLVVPLLVGSAALYSQELKRVIPVENWAEFMTIDLTDSPIRINLRTGYERPLMFPEPISLVSVNEKPVSALSIDRNGKYVALPGCLIEVDGDVAGFSPLQRFGQQKVIFRGVSSNQLYSLMVSSSPTGSRQPVELVKSSEQTR